MSNKSVQLPNYYIGIGASAGGLEALQKLLQNLPTDTGACFIIVQHLSPDYKSMMLELLSRHTSMEIVNVTDGISVRPNTIYLIPPKKNMIVSQGQLLLSDKVPDSGLNLPIDIFFRSLSKDQQHKAIGIILSGTGSDGSRGIKTLKETGALTIVQDPLSAKFDGMPNSAINTGIVDLILRPETMGKKLAEYIQHPLVRGETEVLKSALDANEDTMGEIFNLLKMKSGIDFSNYKLPTVARRIERRMTIRQVNSLQEYVALLIKESYEVEILNNDLLIGVTRFFRDTEAYKALEISVIPELVKHSDENSPIRVWVAACSTGEEAYSIAILFHEELAKQKLKRVVKVFATDINSESISKASSGVYGEEITHDVCNHYLTTYFTKTAGNAYEINKVIRQSVIFAVHNMIVDSPFSNMDLVTCRNTLIYFQHAIQKRVLSFLQFALRKDGYLFLGSSETLREIVTHFNVINERAHIYCKKSDVQIPISLAPPASSLTSKNTQKIILNEHSVRNAHRGTGNNSTTNFAYENLIAHYVPPCILLNDEFDAIHVNGDVNPYVQRFPHGRISNNIKEIINDDLSIAVSSALSRAKNSKEEVYYTDILTERDNRLIALNLRVRHFKESESETSPNFYWIIFEAVDQSNTDKIVNSISFDKSEQAQLRIQDLETELKRNKESLQVTVEELEATNEELQSTNEELMSANEELQSTNEELHAVNEELFTVNSEYQEKITEISQANNDLDEVLNLSKIGIIFLDENMLIRRYTQAASNYINLMDGDINRPLHHISLNFQYDDLLSNITQVFKTNVAVETEVTLEDKRVLWISILPYRFADTMKNKGVAITFADISHAKYAEMGLVKLRNNINNALRILDKESFEESINLLIVDNASDDQFYLLEKIKSIGDFSVKMEVATNCQEALSMMLQQPFDVCVIDYYLGTDTALDVIDNFEKNNINCPVVVLTEKEPKHLKPLLLSHGILDLIEKDTFTLEQLSQSIQLAIRRRQIDNRIQALLSDQSVLTKNKG